MSSYFTCRLGRDTSFSLEADSRYTSHFGPQNHRVSIGNHTLVFIDTPALAEEDVLRANKGHTFESWSAVPRGPVEFVKQTAESRPEGPVILFTHIPLARPLGADCGPLRERGTIQQGFGFGYQNTLMDGATEFLLDRLNPSLILRFVMIFVRGLESDGIAAATTTIIVIISIPYPLLTQRFER